MYPLDLLTLPRTFLRRTRLWYARGRTWREVTPRHSASAARRRAQVSASRAPAARAG